jgi:hypothetical protein
MLAGAAVIVGVKTTVGDGVDSRASNAAIGGYGGGVSVRLGEIELQPARNRTAINIQERRSLPDV